MLNVYPLKSLLSAQKVLLCFVLFCVSALFSPVWATVIASSINEKPFSALWDRLVTFEYPRQEDTAIASWEVGQWQAPGISGSYRLVLTESANNSNRLYVQWLYLTSEGIQEIAYSMSIIDINQFGQYFIDQPVCDSVDDCDTSRVQVTHRYEDMTFGLYLNIEGLGHYSLVVEY